MAPADECPGCYDDDAKAFGWYGPAVVFGLAYPYITPGQVILDIGIGTGLGSAMFYKAGLKVVGMDVSDTMLEACRKKGWATRLVRHDLAVIPYPFGDDAFDHAVSTGVFQFYPDLGPVCGEAGRLVRRGGIFVFLTGDRDDEEPAEIIVPAERTGTGHPVMMFRHSVREITGWLEQEGFQIIGTLQFSVWLDRKRSGRFPARAYLAQNSRER